MLKYVSRGLKKKKKKKKGRVLVYFLSMRVNNRVQKSSDLPSPQKE
jgi:hypothetical protein